MAKNEEVEKPKGGCLGKLAGLVVFLVIVGVAAAVYFASQPQDLSDLEGNSPADAAAIGAPRDMVAVLRKAIEGDYSVSLSEKDINQWLAKELTLAQGGELAEWISLKSVLVRLNDGVAEVIVEREIEGVPFTTSMFIQVEQTETQKGITTQILLHGGGFHEDVPFPKRGGRIGKLMVPQGFLLLVMPEFRKIAALFDEEIELGFQRMARINIEDGRLMLDPKQPSRKAGEGEQTF